MIFCIVMPQPTDLNILLRKCLEFTRNSAQTREDDSTVIRAARLADDDLLDFLKDSRDPSGIVQVERRGLTNRITMVIRIDSGMGELIKKESRVLSSTTRAESTKPLQIAKSSDLDPMTIYAEIPIEMIRNDLNQKLSSEPCYWKWFCARVARNMGQTGDVEQFFMRKTNLPSFDCMSIQTKLTEAGLIAFKCLDEVIKEGELTSNDKGYVEIQLRSTINAYTIHGSVWYDHDSSMHKQEVIITDEFKTRQISYWTIRVKNNLRHVELNDYPKQKYPRT